MRPLLFLVAFAISSPVSAVDWPQWRGPDGQGHAPDTNNLPVEWTETKNVAWKRDLPGRGHSSPVIDGQEIWMTAAIEKPISAAKKQQLEDTNTGNQPLDFYGELQMLAVCVDRGTGKLRHQRSGSRADLSNRLRSAEP